MPFPIVFGIPGNTPPDVLRNLRMDMVAKISRILVDIPRSWTHPFFPSDLLDEESEGIAEGSNTILVILATAMFHGKPNVEKLAKELLEALANSVSHALGDKYDVEAFVGDLDPDLKCYIHATVPAGYEVISTAPENIEVGVFWGSLQGPNEYGRAIRVSHQWFLRSDPNPHGNGLRCATPVAWKRL